MDIFDYKNVIDILIGMSDKQKQTLAEKLVDKFPTVAEDMATFFNQYAQDKEMRTAIDFFFKKSVQ